MLGETYRSVGTKIPSFAVERPVTAATLVFELVVDIVISTNALAPSPPSKTIPKKILSQVSKTNRRNR